MSPQDVGMPEVAPSVPHRWTIGRVADGLAIVAVAVPAGLDGLAPPMRGECATTGANFAMMAGAAFLAARLAWIPLKALNDAAERWLDGVTRGRNLPPEHKPILLDDF